jgi:hypothetical protein
VNWSPPWSPCGLKWPGSDRAPCVDYGVYCSGQRPGVPVCGLDIKWRVTLPLTWVTTWIRDINCVYYCVYYISEIMWSQYTNLSHMRILYRWINHTSYWQIHNLYQSRLFILLKILDVYLHVFNIFKPHHPPIYLITLFIHVSLKMLDPVTLSFSFSHLPQHIF